MVGWLVGWLVGQNMSHSTLTKECADLHLPHCSHLAANGYAMAMLVVVSLAEGQITQHTIPERITTPHFGLSREVAATLTQTSVGFAVGSNPKLSRICQSFPA